MAFISYKHIRYMNTFGYGRVNVNKTFHTNNKLFSFLARSFVCSLVGWFGRSFVRPAFRLCRSLIFNTKPIFHQIVLYVRYYALLDKSNNKFTLSVQSNFDNMYSSWQSLAVTECVYVCVCVLVLNLWM